MTDPIESPRLPRHAPLLLVDCSGEYCHAAVGAAENDHWLHSESLERPAVEGLHEACQRVLHSADLELLDIAALVACDGPGGTIGLRITKVLADTLQILRRDKPLPLFTYDSIAAAIINLKAGNKPIEQGSVVCAGRRGEWFHRSINGDPGEAPHYFQDGSSPPGLATPIWQLRQRFGRESLFPNAELQQLSTPPSPLALENSGYLRTREAFVPLDPHTPEYVRWSGSRHRG